MSGHIKVLSYKQIIIALILISTLLIHVCLLYRGKLSSFGLGCEKESNCNGKSLSKNSYDEYIHVAFFGKYAFRNMKIIRGMATTFHSILKRTDSPLFLHVLLDKMSVKRTSRTLRKVSRTFRRRLNITYYDVEDMANEHRETVSLMRKYFFSKDVGRYNDDIFFLSEVFHEALPKRLKRIIFLDVDLKFQADIQDLYKEFDKFSDQNVIGIAPDLQPQYRVDFAKFRGKNPGTMVGSPGYQGFNTGVVLFDLERMRNSQLYNALLKEPWIKELCHKYDFNGYLGHQDFYTLTGMEYPRLYYKLDCSWNRQLDVGWKNEVESGIFDLYHKCRGKISILHGNGDALLP